MTAGKEQSDNSSATSRRNSDCLTALSLFLINFLKLQDSHFFRAVQQNHDLRQIHVMDSVWRFKTDSTDALTFDTYYNLLWDAAHQYDLHQVKKGPKRKAFFSQQEEISDDDEYANAEEQFSTDPEPEEHSPYSVYQSSFHPKMPQKSFLPCHIWETLSESSRQMIIEHNKKVKLNNPTPYPSGSKTKPNPTL